ncbi:hypothetical protein PHET_12008 [Paragonimus heterotremus]|uniref:Uncharacterized protein n=1 Tax=Paragonimus heterotremus TaxID=100268 RepID=A0A8J4WCC8_9TREM|nr:hypothetical protein PHET_12008 [Paragonimus heterotremus]
MLANRLGMETPPSQRLPKTSKISASSLLGLPLGVIQFYFVFERFGSPIQGWQIHLVSDSNNTEVHRCFLGARRWIIRMNEAGGLGVRFRALNRYDSFQKSLAPESSLSEIIEDEKRSDFEKSMRSNDLQMYRNRQQLHGFGKYGAIRLGELKRNECLLLSDLKHNESKKALAEERKNSEEKLAGALKESSEKSDNLFKKRMLLRNSEPELRELAAKIRQRLNGQCIMSQIEYKQKQHLEELSIRYRWPNT